MATPEEAIEQLRRDLTKSIDAHSPLGDSIYLNGGTVLALAATGTATLLPMSLSFWARVASAIATFVIALSRALDFGGRWRFHTQMRNAYIALRDRVTGLTCCQTRIGQHRPRRSSKISLFCAHRRTPDPAPAQGQ